MYCLSLHNYAQSYPPAMGQRTLYEAGRHGAATPFYQTFLEPADWWKWFKGDEPEENEGWMQVIKIVNWNL